MEYYDSREENTKKSDVKKRYVRPVMEYIMVEMSDVIKTSTLGGGTEPPPNNESGWGPIT